MDYDVVIVGGSLAGSAAATLYGRAGLRVAVIEKQPDPQAYKRTCNHFIVASAVPSLARLGLIPKIEAAGGVPNPIDVWSRYGWVRPEPPAGYPTLRRATTSPASASTRWCASWRPARTASI
jgi:menaquinone-9 beta-reductase